MAYQLSNIWLSLSLMLLFFQSGQGQGKRITRSFSTYFEEYQVKGCFLLYDLQKKEYTQYNPERCRTAFVPASTFKITNTLIGLETGVITGKDFSLKWDSVDRKNPNWNRDQDLKSAFQVSAVWFYQEVARRIGEKQMQAYVKKLKYGNGDISGGIDQFWLSGGLRISPEEQVAFLQKIYHNQLPVSKRSIDILKEIMVLEAKDGYVLRGKTGWADPAGINVGWFVGYLEREGNVYFFATNVESPEPAPESFAPARRAITEKILRDLHLLP
jgi:beta-lactamase class D